MCNTKYMKFFKSVLGGTATEKLRLTVLLNKIWQTKPKLETFFIIKTKKTTIAIHCTNRMQENERQMFLQFIREFHSRKQLQYKQGLTVQEAV